jgi:hypothetical protein
MLQSYYYEGHIHKEAPKTWNFCKGFFRMLVWFSCLIVPLCFFALQIIFTVSTWFNLVFCYMTPIYMVSILVMAFSDEVCLKFGLLDVKKHPRDDSVHENLLPQTIDDSGDVVS